MQRSVVSSPSVSLQPRTAARVMLDVFVRRGLRAAFGIPGGLISPMYDALVDVPQIRLVHNRHEGMAAFCAMGHALTTGTPALVLTTSGPGFTNAITGVAAAFVEEIPLIFIAGEVSSAAASRGAIQDSSTNGLDAVAMMRTITRWSARVDAPGGALGIAEQAVRTAMGPRPGPVFLSMPLDIGASHAAWAPLSFSAAPAPATIDVAACAAAAAKLRRARRPLLVVGNGARDAAPEILALVERLAIPVVTTPHAKGVFPDGHAHHLGGIGLGGHPSALAYLQSAPDVVCIIGSRLNDYSTNAWGLSLAGTESTIQIDREPWLIGRNYPVTTGIVGDATQAVRAILKALPSAVAVPRRQTGGIVRIDADSEHSDEVPLKPARVLSALQKAFPDALWSADQGEHCAYAIHYLRIERPGQFRTMVGLASMGSGIGVAIGARHADTKRTVIGICGDGGFAMHAGEILTCVEHGIDVIFVVFNDGRWNMVHHGFRAVFGRAPAELPSHVADLAGVAESFGAIGVRICEPEDLDVERLRRLAGLGRPVLLDVRIDPMLALSAASRSAALRDLKGGAE